MCADRAAAIIADEVFADYELEPGATIAAGRPAARQDVLTFSLGGLSKSVGLPQIKLGWIAAAGPACLTSAALQRLELICDTYLSVSTPVQEAAAELLVEGRGMRDQIARRIAHNYRWLRDRATESTGCSVLPAEGGWSAVLRVPSLDTEENLVIDLLKSRDVLVHPGYFFDFPRESYLIVSLLTPLDSFAEGVSRILRHFTCSTAVPA
jgi:hypothetical protein